MSKDILTQFDSIDNETLQNIVQQDQCSQSFELTNWSVTRLSDKGIMNPDGLFLFSGQGRDGISIKPWSVVLKIIKHPRVDVAQNDSFYGKRELLAAQSGLLAGLPGPVFAPRFYRSSEYEDSIWLWMEHIHDDHKNRWALDDYAFAARQLGRWNGCYRAGTPLPAYPWLAVDHIRSWVGDGNPADVWKDPQIGKGFPDSERARHIQLCEDFERLVAVLNRLPQVFSHFDYQRRNLFICEENGSPKRMVAIDWAGCGLGAIGSDLNSLIQTSIILLEHPFTSLDDLERTAIQAYIEGLREAGWKGPVGLARLGYLIYSSLHFTLIFPGGVTWWTAEEQYDFAMQQFGMAGKELRQAYLNMFSALLDRADEARRLANDLQGDINR